MGRALQLGADELTRKEIGARIRAARRSRGTTMKELGQALGLSLQQVHKYEAGANRVSVPVMMQIARVLEFPLSHFIPAAEQDDEAIDLPVLQPLSGLEPDEIETLLALAEAPAKIRRAVVQMVRTVFEEMGELGPMQTA